MNNFGFISKKKLAKEIARLYFEYDNTPCSSVELFYEDCASQSALNMLCKRLKIKPAHRSILGGGTGEYKKEDLKGERKMNDDFRNLYAKMKSGENIPPEEFLTKVCGLSPEEAKEYINSVKEGDRE